MTLSARYESRCLGKGDKFHLRFPSMIGEMIERFAFGPWLAWNYAAELSANKKVWPLLPGFYQLGGADAHSQPRIRRVSVEGVRPEPCGTFY